MNRRDLNRKLITAIAVALAATIAAFFFVTSRPSRPHLQAAPEIVSCTEMSYGERLRIEGFKRRADSSVGGMGMYQYKITYKSPPGFPQHVETVHPNIGLWTQHGMLFGSDRGEFGGELVFQTGHGSPENYQYLYAANIEDLFVMPYGIVATTGYFHLDSDFGDLLIVTFDKIGVPSVKKLYTLPGGVRSSWVTKDNQLLVNTRSGSYLLKSENELVKVECKKPKKHWWQVI